MGVTAGILAGSEGRLISAEDKVKEIRANSFNARGQWYFDPAGLFIEKGETIRWVGGDQGPTITAFHPSNYNHELRIPENAEPFNSRNLMKHGRLRFFELTFDVEGRKARFEVRSPTPLNPLQREQLEQFQCPKQL